MIKHMIIWKLKTDLADPMSIKATVKAELEGLVGKIEGLLEMKIHTNGIESSSGDLMMDSTFIGKEALTAYQKHSLHQAVANRVVRPNMEQRLSFDYEV